MIPRKIGRLPDRRGFHTGRGYSNMAMNKSAGAKKSTAKGGAAKKSASTKAAGSTKKATVKKAAPKLSDPQTEMLKRVHAHTDPTGLGYRAEKKPENKTLEKLAEHKLLKRGKKHKESGHFHYQVSNAGVKHLKSLEGAGSAPKTS